MTQIYVCPKESYILNQKSQSCYFCLRARNSTARYVRPSVGQLVSQLVGRLVGWLVPHLLFGHIELFLDVVYNIALIV